MYFQRVIKGTQGTGFEVDISVATSAGATAFAGGSAVAVAVGGTSKTAVGVAASADKIAPGIMRVVCNAHIASQYNPGDRYHVYVVSGSVDGNTKNLIAGAFEVDSDILLRTGVVSANASTLQISSSIDANNRYVGCTVRVINGTGKGSPGHIIVSSSASADNRLKVTPTFGETPDTTSIVEIVAAPYVEAASSFPAQLVNIGGFSVTAFTGLNWITFWDNDSSQNTFIEDSFTDKLNNIEDAVLSAGVEVAAIQSAAVVNILNQTMAESTAAPNWANMTIGEALKWIVSISLNKVDQTASKQTIYTSAGSAMGSASVADDGTTVTRNQFL